MFLLAVITDVRASCEHEGLLNWLVSGTAVEKEIKLTFLSEHTLPKGEWPTEESSKTTLKLCHGKSGPMCWLHTTTHLL